MKTLDHMKLDMANFHIQQARPLIVDQSVDYEKKKFKEFLAIQVEKWFVYGWTKKWAPGLVNYVPAVANHFCLNLPKNLATLRSTY